jgi:hypothetical protein
VTEYIMRTGLKVSEKITHEENKAIVQILERQ